MTPLPLKTARFLDPLVKWLPITIVALISSKNVYIFLFLFQNIGELLNQNTANLQQKLCDIGDKIVFKLVQWTRRLPFYHDLPVDIHTKLLTQKWHELLVLTTSSYQAIYGCSRMGTTRSDGGKAELHQEVREQRF